MSSAGPAETAGWLLPLFEPHSGGATRAGGMEPDSRDKEIARLHGQIDALRAQSRLLESFVVMARSSSSEGKINAIMQKTLEVCTRLTGADNGSLFLLNQRGVVTDAILTRGETAFQERIFLIGRVLDKGLAGWVRDHLEVGLVTDTRTDHRWLNLPGQPYAVGSALAVPILRGEMLLGILTLLNARHGHFNQEALALMRMTAEQIALVLENTQLYVHLEDSLLALGKAKKAVEAYSRALDREMAKGRKIQRDFLPKELPRLAHLEIAARFLPALQVSGDFYDAFPLNRGLVGLAIGDVSDKGVGAALFMSLIRSLIRVFALQCSRMPPSAEGPEAVQSATLKAVAIANGYITAEHGQEGMFATLFFGVLDAGSGKLTYVNAGHEPVLVLGPGGPRCDLAATGPAIGLVAEADYAPHRFQLTSGDILLGYTDGVTEARSASDALFTRARLKRTVAASASTTASRVLDRIEAELSAFMGGAPQSDDITLLAARWR